MSSQKVLTSTPNLKKNVKTKRMREDELKAEIAKMELEKTLLKVNSISDVLEFIALYKCILVLPKPIDIGAVF